MSDSLQHKLDRVRRPAKWPLHQIVDQADLDMINAAFNSQEGDVEYSPAFDHDGDGYITGSDIAVTVSMTTR